MKEQQTELYIYSPCRLLISTVVSEAGFYTALGVYTLLLVYMQVTYVVFNENPVFFSIIHTCFIYCFVNLSKIRSKQFSIVN